MLENQCTENLTSKKVSTKVYSKRWYILFAFNYYGCINGIQTIEYSSITQIVAKYYGVSTFAVNWTSIVYMVLYPFLVFPVSYLIEKKVMFYYSNHFGGGLLNKYREFTSVKKIEDSQM